MSKRPPPSPEQSSKIFISYRREDSAGHAGRLFDALNERFRGRVFMDIDALDPGIDFIEAIDKAVSSCNVLIVVIGRQWLTAADKRGQRRLDNEDDFVRVEIEKALERNIRVIPVLVQDTAMPLRQDLPEEMAKLARRNAIELSDDRWAYDVERLIEGIEEALAADQDCAPAARPEASARPSPEKARPLDLTPQTPSGQPSRRPAAAGIKIWIAVLMVVLLGIIGGMLYAFFRKSSNINGNSSVASNSQGSPATPTKNTKNSKDTANAGASSNSPGGVAERQDCLPYNPNNLRIEDEGADGWLLSDGRSRMVMLDNKTDAEKALAMARQHTAQCFIGRNNRRRDRKNYIVSYWTGDSGMTTTIADEDCLPYAPASLRVEDEGRDGWLLTDGRSRMLMLDTKADAEQALAVARQYSAHCFIGRNNVRPHRRDYILEYWK